MSFSVIPRVALIPGIIERNPAGRGQVDVSVFQLVEHVAEDIKQVIVADAGLDPFAVLVINGIPVNLFGLKEAVLFVDDFPQLFEVTYRIVGKVFFFDTAGE